MENVEVCYYKTGVGDRKMKIRYSSKIISFVGFAGTIVMCALTGAEYWQGMVAGTLFGIWLLIAGVEE